MCIRDSPYPYSLCWLDCFADPNLARQLYASAFPLIDVTVMPDDEIMQHRRMALLELIQKHIRQRDLMGLVEQMACLLSSGYALSLIHIFTPDDTDKIPQ